MIIGSVYDGAHKDLKHKLDSFDVKLNSLKRKLDMFKKIFLVAAKLPGLAED